MTRENASYDDDPRDEERARDADSRRFACLSFVSGLFTPKATIADKGCSHVFFFFRRVKSSDDVRSVLRNVCVLIDRLAIKRPVLVRGRLMGV